MARKDSNRDFSPVIDAAQRWIKRSLIGDLSVFTDERLWSQPLAEELKRFFIDALDVSDAKFIEKLERQLGSASQSSKQLMAEILWVLCLFPSNSRPATKRDQVVRVWGPGGQATIAGSRFLTDGVLAGIGSAGTAYHTHHWREVSYLILILLKFKPLSSQAREAVFASYKNLTDWLETLPESTNRQFPHMLGFFAFPEMVERISSSREKLKILKGFGVLAAKNWNHRKLDEELLALRQRLEGEFPGQPLDFYHPPLVTRWKPEEESETVVNEDTVADIPIAARTLPLPDSPTNLILYGPPGTGKTRALQQLQAKYTETPQSQDRSAWLESIVANYGWREVIAVALAKLGPTNVPSIRQHELVIAKSRERQSLKNLGNKVWGALQRHTPTTVTTVEFSNRAAPFIFTKEKEPIWCVLPDWQTNDEEAARLAKTYESGQKNASPIRRFRQVTFHPSYSYEDFVRGIRPVAAGDDGRTEFRLVDGVFKQICDEASANQSKRYALFIDEINRGNIAKIFGELITLIEPDKRVAFGPDGAITKGMRVHLPGVNGGEIAEPPFGVPVNLDLYGTMNTADRSIALLDVALRRRFDFREMEPRYDEEVFPFFVGKVDRAALLRRINDRLEYLLDRDHRIGHAYLMKANTLEGLRQAFANQIIPLLQEYFFDDLSKVALTLSGHKGVSSFVTRETLRHEQLFPDALRSVGSGVRERFVVTNSATWAQGDFVAIYAAPVQPAGGETAETT